MKNACLFLIIASLAASGCSLKRPSENRNQLPSLEEMEAQGKLKLPADFLSSQQKNPTTKSLLKKDFRKDNTVEENLKNVFSSPSQQIRNNPLSSDTARNAPLLEVDVRVEEASIKEIITAFFDTYLSSYSYTLTNTFPDKKVNWVLKGWYRAADAFYVLASFLEIHQIYIGYHNGMYVIGSRAEFFQPSPEHKESSLPDSSAFSQDPISLVIGMFRLQYLQVKEALPLLQNLLTQPDMAYPLDSTNTLLIFGTTSTINRAESFLRSIDVSLFQGRSVLLYTPRYRSAQVLSALLDTLPTKLNLKGAAKPFESAIIPNDKRLIIVLPTAGYKGALIDFLNEVDQPGEEVPELFLYKMQEGSVSYLSTLLIPLINKFFDNDPSPPFLQVDELNNSLFILSTPSQYYKIRGAIQALDKREPTVFADITIVEVQLSEALQFGVEWFLRGKDEGNQSADFRFNAFPSGGISDGFQFNILNNAESDPANKTFATLKMLASETNVQILSRPRIFVSNGQTATISSIDEKRIIKSVLSTSVQESGTSIPKQEFETKEIGLKLSISPQVRGTDTIMMDIKVEDSRDGTVGADTGQPTFNKRSLETKLASTNGQTVVLGGLMRYVVRKAKKKIPLLGDLPLLNKIFSSTSNIGEKTELLLFVTAYIIFDSDAAQMLTEALKRSTILQTTTPPPPLLPITPPPPPPPITTPPPPPPATP